MHLVMDAIMQVQATYKFRIRTIGIDDGDKMDNDIDIPGTDVTKLLQ